MKAEVLAQCRRERLFSAGDRVVCAVSGGADSMAMLWCLYQLRETLSVSVAAAHFNHRLRGAESERDEAFVRSFCAAHGIELTVESGDVAAYAAQSSLSTEAAARELRYAFLERLPFDKIAVAHTADDNAETVLHHLLRGSGLRGLCGIPPTRGRVVRPLLTVGREDVLAYLRAEGLQWVEDSTNALDDCTRNRLRHRVLPLLKEENPNLTERLTAQSALLRADDRYLDALAQELLDRARRDGGWHCPTLRGAPDALLRRALRLLVRQALPQDVSATHIAALQALLHNPSPSARLSLPDGWIACRCYDLLQLRQGEFGSFSPTVLNFSGETHLVGSGWKISCEISEKNQTTPYHFAVKYDMIRRSILTARPRRSGDTLLLSGGHRVTLKKLFIDRKIPRFLRDTLPVIEADGVILGVAGLGADSHCRPAAGEAALMIHIEKEEM